MIYPNPLYPMRRADGVDVDLQDLEDAVKRGATTTAIVLAPEGPRHERSWCVRDWSLSTPHLAVVLPPTRGGWEWSVDGGPSGHNGYLFRAMLFAEAAVHVVDLERQAEGLGPSRPGPLYLLAAELIRRAIGETKAYREALLRPMPDDSPKVKAAVWAHGVAGWPADGLFQDENGKQRNPRDVLAWGASWPRGEDPPALVRSRTRHRLCCPSRRRARREAPPGHAPSRRGGTRRMRAGPVSARVRELQPVVRSRCAATRAVKGT